MISTSLPSCLRRVIDESRSQLIFSFYSQPVWCVLPQMMEDTQSDFTMTFRQLSELSAQQLLDTNFTQVNADMERFNILGFVW